MDYQEFTQILNKQVQKNDFAPKRYEANGCFYSIRILNF